MQFTIKDFIGKIEWIFWFKSLSLNNLIETLK